MPLPELPLLPPLEPAPPDCEPEVLPLLPELDPLAPGLDDGELGEGELDELAPLPWLPLSPLPPPLHAASVAENNKAGARSKYFFMGMISLVVIASRKMPGARRYAIAGGWEWDLSRSRRKATAQGRRSFAYERAGPRA